MTPCREGGLESVLSFFEMDLVVLMLSLVQAPCEEVK